jgi:Fic family protein
VLYLSTDHVLLEGANQALGRLDGLTRTLPDAGLFIYIYLRKEAVLSSMIEGTQSSLSQLLMFEGDDLPGIPADDVQEVSNYVSALQHGLARLRDGFPLSCRLLREIHAVLLTDTRGADRPSGSDQPESIMARDLAMLPALHHRLRCGM